MGTLRTKEMEEKYEAYKKQRDSNAPCDLCTKETLQTFSYWKITDCMFPWDKLAKVQHMIMPLRHVTEQEITQEEWYELNSIKHNFIHDNYEVIMEATNRKKSIPGHFHLHLIINKE